MAFNTGNPVPSTDGRDLSDNAEALDKIVNQDPLVTTRTGKQIKSISSIVNTVDAAATQGVVDINADVAAVTASADAFDVLALDRVNKIGVIYNSPIRDWSPSLLVDDLRAHRNPPGTGDIYIPTKPLPFTTGAVFNTDDWELLQGITDGDIINDLSQAYEFATVAEFKASTIEFPDTKRIYLADRDVYFNKITGTGTGNDLNIVASTSVNQSIVIIRTKILMSQHGIIGNEVDVVAKMKILQDQARAIFIPVIFDIELFISESIILGGERQDFSFLKKITTTSTDPILEIKCGFSKVHGVALGYTDLISPLSPNGIIHIDEEGVQNIAYNDIGGFRLVGQRQPTGGGSKGLVMRSLDGYIFFTYYNKIHDMVIQDCDTGAFLAGNINANFFQNFFMVGVGNEQLYSDSAGFFMTEALTTDNTPAGGGATKFEGPLENQISKVFHTGSANAVSLFFSGKVYNNIISWSAETGGATANGFKTVNSGFAFGNVITMTSIAFGGNDIDPVFFTLSTLINDVESNLRNVNTNDFLARNHVRVGDATGADISQEGMFIGDGTNHITKDGDTNLLLNRLSSYGKIIDLRVDGVAGAGIGVTGGDRLHLFSQNGTGLSFASNVIFPVDEAAAPVAKDNLIDLGSASARWKEIFAGNATINTSDEREKQFADIEQKEKDVALVIKANIKKFKWDAAIEREAGGGKKARIHFGVGAQFIGRAFTDAGLNPDDYALFCYDEWEAEYATISATFDDDGNELTPEFVRTTLEAGNRYGIRYSELSMFILSAI